MSGTNCPENGSLPKERQQREEDENMDGSQPFRVHADTMVPTILENDASAELTVPIPVSFTSAANDELNEKEARYDAPIQTMDDDDVPVPEDGSSLDAKHAEKRSVEILEASVDNSMLPESASHDDFHSKMKHEMIKEDCIDTGFVLPNDMNAPGEISHQTQAAPPGLTISHERTSVPMESTPQASNVPDHIPINVNTRQIHMAPHHEHNIFVPNAMLVDEVDGDIPSAEVVVPEKYSVTIAGRKVHAGVLVFFVLVVIGLVVGLSVSFTRPAPILVISSSPSVSNEPSRYPSYLPSFAPSTELHFTLVRRIYGDDTSGIEFNQERGEAMEWLKQELANLKLSDYSPDQDWYWLRERYALVLLFFATNNVSGAGWYDKVNFLSKYSVCRWKGVLCNKDRRVSSLKLDSNNLQGSLPTELGFLAELEVLRLNNNKIKKIIPDIFGSLQFLSELILSDNDISGTIPRSLSNVTALKEVDLSNNEINGTIPDILGSLPFLSRLILNDNKISGTIPCSLSNATALKEVDLSNNEINGTLVDVDDLQQLITFKVDRNILTGDVPVSFANIKSLDTFHIDNNKLSGTVDFLCKNMPKDYELDCKGKSPEVVCSCCRGCTIVSKSSCEAEENRISFTIEPEVTDGTIDDSFSWELFEIDGEIDDGPVDPVLLLAGGDYDTDYIVFSWCFKYPGRYYISTQSNLNLTGGSGSISIGGIYVRSQDDETLIMTKDGFEIVTTSHPTHTPTQSSLPTLSLSPTETNSPTQAPTPIPTEIIGDKFEIPRCIGVSIRIDTDYSGDKTSWEWEIINTLNESVVASAAEGSYTSNSTFYDDDDDDQRKYECLPRDGCYSFTGNGWFELYVNGRNRYQGDEFVVSDEVVIGGSCSWDVPSNGVCSSVDTVPINVTIQHDEYSNETSWDVYDELTGQIYMMDEGDAVDNSLTTTYQCIPKGNCTVFAIYDSACDGLYGRSFYEVTYDGVVVVSSSGNFYDESVSFFGPNCP